MRTKILPLALALSLTLISRLAHGQTVYISGYTSADVGDIKVYYANWDFPPQRTPTRVISTGGPKGEISLIPTRIIGLTPHAELDGRRVGTE